MFVKIHAELFPTLIIVFIVTENL